MTCGQCDRYICRECEDSYSESVPGRCSRETCEMAFCSLRCMEAYLPSCTGCEEAICVCEQNEDEDNNLWHEDCYPEEEEDEEGDD